TLGTNGNFTYEAVRLRIIQIWGSLAQLKNLDSLKLCDLGFLRVLMTIGRLIFHVDAPLAPDGVTSKTEISKNCLRRHAIWSQWGVDMKNEYAYRHQHPQEPLIA
ncbi:hypothetical protein PRIPAC_83265, partial [Pristionchus pacificus]|uniref:Uncharacterized protein n=1 Tax=Pristionchus pacificus TaxID=54126 RepID=A0A2A6BT07_PRIPA